MHNLSQFLNSLLVLFIKYKNYCLYIASASLNKSRIIFDPKKSVWVRITSMPFKMKNLREGIIS
jgi:hypothetical protein